MKDWYFTILDLDEFAYYNGGTFIESNRETNQFLKKYIEIRNLFSRDIMCLDAFHDIVNDLLNRLPKQPMDIFEYVDKPKVPSVILHEETPFFDEGENPLKGSVDCETFEEIPPEVIEEIYEQYYDSLKCENVIKRFAKTNNITFLGQKQGSDKTSSKDLGKAAAQPIISDNNK